MVDRAAEDNAAMVHAPGRDELALRVLAAVVGAAGLVAGGVAVFVTDNGAGSGALLAVGTLFLLVAAFGSRIVKLKGAGVEVELAKEAAKLEVQARQARQRGDEGTAEELTAQADVLLDLALAARPAATAYERLRRTQASGPARTRQLEAILDEARAAGAAYTPEQVRQLFFGGTDGERIYAIGLMQGNPDSRDLGVVLDGIRSSRSAFEQFHSLSLADEMVAELDEDGRRELARAIEAARRRHLVPGTDRWPLSERILAKLERHEPTA